MLPPKHTYDMFNHIQKYCKQFVIQDPFTSAETKNSNKKKKKKMKSSFTAFGTVYR